jgi:hypothetical protein
MLCRLLSTDVSEQPADWFVMVGKVKDGSELDVTNLHFLLASKTLMSPAHRNIRILGTILQAATTVMMQFTNGHR